MATTPPTPITIKVRPASTSATGGVSTLVDEQFEYQFEWDPSKAQRNAREHKVSFEEAVEVFSDADDGALLSFGEIEVSPREAIAFVKRHGVVLQAACGPVPSLAEAIAGGRIRGSWWGHAKGRIIFQAARAVCESPQGLGLQAN